MPDTTRSRHLTGTAPILVQTDVHGNLEDFQRVRHIWQNLSDRHPGARWVILGDLVHGPDERARQRFPELYDFPDQSFQIVAEVAALIQQYPERVFFVMGNHEHAHVGGPTTSKFHPDEAEYLQSRLDDEQHEFLVDFIEESLLMVTTCCGVTLTHGCPGLELHTPAELDDIPLREDDCNDRQREILRHFLRTYGQPGGGATRFLNSINDKLDHPQQVNLHGHDSAREGYFTEGGNQVCPCIFGATRDQKRYTVLDPTRRYTSAGEVVSEALYRVYPRG